MFCRALGRNLVLPRCVDAEVVDAGPLYYSICGHDDFDAGL